MSNQLNDLLEAREKQRATQVQIENGWICEQLLGWSRSEVQPGHWKPLGQEISRRPLPSFMFWEECGWVINELQARVQRGGLDCFASATVEQLTAYLRAGRLTPESIRSAAVTYLVTVNAEVNCEICRPERKCPDHGPSLTSNDV